MLLSINNVIHEIELRYCHDGILSDDVFEEFELDIPNECEELENGAFEISKRDFQNLVDYWKGQVDDFNTYGESQELGFSENDSYILYVDGRKFWRY